MNKYDDKPLSFVGFVGNVGLALAKRLWQRQADKPQYPPVTIQHPANDEDNIYQRLGSPNLG